MENIINADPTLKMYIDNPIDPNNFDWHVELKCTAIRIALYKYLHNYRYE